MPFVRERILVVEFGKKGRRRLRNPLDEFYEELLTYAEKTLERAMQCIYVTTPDSVERGC